ncbi:unnamed protein product [Prorocentrum cordatum]|uniref:Uncharacterized protein n=1 Tax=Prorocentrum cordatum TaxID=2364126 RepID=A0ABN9YJ07_9DINO|nr:unnamed protein product [Polarella glacialis]
MADVAMQPGIAKLEFAMGAHGLVWATGTTTVERVSCQARLLGVRPGWSISMINGVAANDSATCWHELLKCKKSGQKYNVYFTKDEASIRADQQKAEAERAKKMKDLEESRRQEETAKKIREDADKKRADELAAKKQEYWDKRPKTPPRTPERAARPPRRRTRAARRPRPTRPSPRRRRPRAPAARAPRRRRTRTLTARVFSATFIASFASPCPSPSRHRGRGPSPRAPSRAPSKLWPSRRSSCSCPRTRSSTWRRRPGSWRTSSRTGTAGEADPGPSAPVRTPRRLRPRSARRCSPWRATCRTDAASAVGAGCAGGRDGIDLIAFEAREALQGARNLAAKLLGEEPQEPPAPPPLNEPQGLALIAGQTDEVSQVLKEAAEVAAMALELQKKQEEKKKKSRSRSRKRRRKRSTSSSSSSGKKKKKKKD